jgi:integrase
MGRASTGTVRILKNKDGKPQWHAKWTRVDKTRSKWEPLDGKIALDDKPRAKALAARMAPRIRKASEGQPGVETVSDYAIRWCKWREGRGLGCVGGDRATLTNHLLPVIGELDVRSISRDDLKRLVTALDEKVKAGTTVDAKGKQHTFGWKTAVCAWGVARALFRDAQKAKDVSLCVRDDNPAEGVAGPDVGTNKARTYLWPSEFLTLVSSERVHVRWGRLFALSVYTYTRAGELAALKWEDVDLEHETIHVHRSKDRVRKRGVKPTKSETARRIPIEPTLLPLLKAMRREAGGKGYVFQMPSAGGLSYKLKRYLRRAGVKRPDLFASDATRKAITFHDLRATGITWMSARGDDPLRIMQRAGHEDFETTKIYLREAENLSKGFGAVFPTLPRRLLRNAPNRPGTLSGSGNSQKQGVLGGADENRIRQGRFEKTERARGLGRQLAEIVRRAVAVRFRWNPSRSALRSGVAAT